MKAWIFESNGRIRSAAFGTCVTVPDTLEGRMRLAPCSNLLIDLQQFPVAPPPDDQDKICTKPLPNIGRLCAAYTGRPSLTVTQFAVAPEWFRWDQP